MRARAASTRADMVVVVLLLLVMCDVCEGVCVIFGEGREESEEEGKKHFKGVCGGKTTIG